MKTLKEKAPALWTIFFKSYTLTQIERPYGCSDCPFAQEHNSWADRPNPSDRDEGYYDCSLLSEHRIWGESPRCSSDDWRTKGAKEVELIADYFIKQEIINEKADVLFSDFCKALQDESNGELTVNQLREKLLVNIEPQVIAAFNAKIRPTQNL